MFVAHNYAFQIEVTVRAMFKSCRGGIGGIADADFIENNPFIAIILVLGNFYNKIDNNSKNKMNKFIQTYYCEMGKSIKEIGEEKIKEIIKEFNNIVSTV